MKIAAATGRFEDEGWRIRGDGTKFWASVIITAIRVPGGGLLGYGKVTRDLAERKRSEEQLRELARSLLRAQDEKRGRLGRELHDTFGQYLTALKIALDSRRICNLGTDCDKPQSLDVACTPYCSSRVFSGS